jgi:hypothetical protein
MKESRHVGNGVTPRARSFHGLLARFEAEALRGRSIDDLTPQEAKLVYVQAIRRAYDEMHLLYGTVDDTQFIRMRDATIDWINEIFA